MSETREMSGLSLVKDIPPQIVGIDGPQRAFFELGFDGREGQYYRFIYRTLAFGSKYSNESHEALEKAILAVEAALLARCEELGTELPLIVWRQRPEHIHDKTRHIHKWRCRLVTVPDLTLEQWRASGVITERAVISEVV